MSTVNDIITDVLYEMDDATATRWDNASQLLSMVKKGVKRAERICITHGLDFAKASETLVVSSGASTVALPADFNLDIGLYYDNDRIPKVTIDEYERSSSGDMWIIDGTNIQFKEEATADTDYKLWYWPKLDIDSYSTSGSGTTMPWSGRLDDAVVEYVSMRLKNIDEYNVNTEADLLRDMEQSILATYKPLTAILQTPDGWNQ